MSKMFLLFETDLPLPVVNALSLLCLQQAGEEAGSSAVPLHFEKLCFRFSSFSATIIVWPILLGEKPLSYYSSISSAAFNSYSD